jgi:hypothetical protein
MTNTKSKTRTCISDENLIFRTVCIFIVLFAGSYVLLWRRGSSVLTAANLMVTRDSRFRLVDGYNLEINNVMPQDAGDYVCQISDGDNRDQIHTVEILGKHLAFYGPSNLTVTYRYCVEE